MAKKVKKKCAQPSPGQRGSIRLYSDLGRGMLTHQMFSFFFLPLLMSMMSYGLEQPFGHLGSTVPAVFPLPNLPSTSSFPARIAVQKAEKTPALCKHCSAKTKISLHFQLCVQHKCKTWPHSHCDENQLYCSQNHHTCSDILIWVGKKQNITVSHQCNRSDPGNCANWL